MSDETAIQLKDRTAKLLAAIAGGAGLMSVFRISSGLLMQVSLTFQLSFGVPLSMAISLIAGLLFASWLGWVLVSPKLANWASIGFLIIASVPIIQFVLNMLLEPLSNNSGFSIDIWSPYLLYTFLPLVGFRVGSWLRAKRS
jgi:hypothetical protein